MMIFKNLFNGFFNTIGRILAYIFIAIIICLVFGSCNVNAAEYGYSSGTYAVGWSGCSLSGTNCIWKQWSSQLSYGERQVKPDLDGLTYGSRISIRVYGGDDYVYKKGNTYHFRYIFSTTDDIFESMKYWYLYATNGNTNSSTSGQFELDFESDVIGYKITRNNSGTNYFDVVISVSPSQDYKYFNFYLSMPITISNVGPNTGYTNVLTGYGIPQNIQLRSLEVNYSEGVGSQIDNQTTIIQNNFNETNDNIKDVNDTLKETEKTNKSILQTIKDLPNTLVNLFIDMLKSLFIPTEAQLKDIIDSSSSLASNFGFVGQTVDFFIRLVNVFINAVAGNGCITIPSFEVSYSYFGLKNLNDMTFWESSEYCLVNHGWLGDDRVITIIRTMTSITLIILVLNFAYIEFHKILSKESD